MTQDRAMKPRVRDLMTIDPILVGPEVTLRRVRALMNEASIRHLPVVDERGIIGLVSDRDLTFLHAVPGVIKEIDNARIEEILDAPVGVVMKSRFLVERDVVSVGPDDDLSRAVNLLIAAGVGALPVLDDQGQVVGILSTIDILRWIGDEVLRP